MIGDVSRVAPHGNKIAAMFSGYKISAKLSVVCIDEKMRIWGIARNSKKSERGILVFALIGCDKTHISLLRAIAKMWDLMGVASNDQLIESLEGIGLSVKDAWDCSLRNHYLGIKLPRT